MSDYRKLLVWQKAHGIVLDVYKMSATFPKDEIYGLTSQIRRAAVSVPANIAEGSGRGGNIEFARFLQIAMGSLNELEYHLYLSHDLGLLNTEVHRQFEGAIVEVRRMLTGLIHKVKPTS